MDHPDPSVAAEGVLGVGGVAQPLALNPEPPTPHPWSLTSNSRPLTPIPETRSSRLAMTTRALLAALRGRAVSYEPGIPVIMSSRLAITSRALWRPYGGGLFIMSEVTL